MRSLANSTPRSSWSWIESTNKAKVSGSETLSTVTGYSLSGYGHMIQCEPRMSAYATALRAAITPGCTVIDLGAGPGVFALLACRYGAGKVIAIEPNPAIGVLQQLARDNGCADRIEIFQGLSTDYKPSSKADVIVSDLRGGVPLFEAHIHAIRDARDRLLAPRGVMIPARDQLRIAAVESAVTYKDYDEPWQHNAYDLDLSAGSRFAINTQAQVALTEETLLGPAQHVATLDYAQIADSGLRSNVALPIDRAGLVHGLLFWFDAELADGAHFSNAPGQPPQVYGQTFWPLERPLAVVAGDTLHADIRANRIDGAYVWSWNTALARGPDGHAEPCFRQSTFLANILHPRQLAKHSESFVPEAKERIAIDAFCLSLIDGDRSLRAIADRVEVEFPDAFANSSDALNRVTEVAGRYGKRD